MANPVMVGNIKGHRHAQRKGGGERKRKTINNRYRKNREKERN